MKTSSPSFSREPSIFQKIVTVFLTALIGCPSSALAAGPTFVPVTVQTSYDGNGNLTGRLDGDGAQTITTYDAMNRVIGIDYPGGSSPDVAFTYDANGNRTTMVDATGTTTYSHDIFDRLSRVDYPDGGFVSYRYDLVGNVKETSYGNTKAVAAGKGYTTIQYTFDADNRIATVKNLFANTTTSYTYDDAGHPLRRILPNGVTTDYVYDTDGRLISVDHKKADSTRICKYAYTLNAIGNRTQVIETLPDGSTKTTGYTYDPLDRLSTVSYPDGRSVAYLYDSFGNRTKMTEVTGAVTKVTDYTYDSDSRLLSTKVNNVADETFAYDTTGNLIQRVRSSDNRQIDYAYDAENRLVRYYDGTNNVQYIYNGSGNRVAKIVNGVQVNYVNDLNNKNVQVLAETDSGGNSQRVYEWGNELIDQVVGATKGFHLLDAINGSVRRVIDPSGSILNTYEYDAYGQPITNNEAQANDFQFDGECQEGESGLIFLRSRFLDSGTGRFLTRDTLGASKMDSRTLNKYTFVRADPINLRDPSGQCPPCAIIGGELLIDALAGTTAYVGVAEGGAAIGAGALADAGIGLNASILYGFVAQRGAGALASEALFAAGSRTSIAIGSAASKAPGLTQFGSYMLGATGAAEGTSSILGLAAGSTASNAFFWGGVAKTALTLNTMYGDFLYGLSTSSSVAIPSINPKNVGTYNMIGDFEPFMRPGGVALNKSASVLLDINNITGGTYDATTGQIILFGRQDSSSTALPKMSLDDLAVAVKARQLGTFPVVSIEDPVVSNPPQWPGRNCFTVRYGPFYTDSLDGQRKVLDVSSKTHFGWVMFEADRLMKSLGLGKDNRTLQTVSSAVPGYVSWMNLSFQYKLQGNVTTRYWFNPKEIVVESSPDGKSMQISKAEMQLSTETMFSSNGQVESTPDAEYFANWFTSKYDAIAEEQVSYDGAGQPHKIFKELKQLAYLAGVVKWIQENNIPVDLEFLKDYQPEYFDSAPSVTPQTSITEQRVVNIIRPAVVTRTITGGVNFCHDLVTGNGGNPSGLGAVAATSRPSETSLAWSFSNGGTSYNATALSVDRTEKDGSVSPSAMDAQFKVNGATALSLGRYFDSFNITPSLFGWGWQAQPYALEFKGNRENFSICHQTWNGYGEVWFMDRASQGAYKFIPAGTYDKVSDPLGLASRFNPTKDILVYRYENKSTPGLLFSDNSTGMTMRLDNGTMLDFNFDGLLLRIQDRNGNRIDYGYDASKRLTSIGQPGGKSISLSYNAQNRVSTATLPGSRTVTYTYDAAGNLISAQADAPTGRIARYSYDASHNLLQVQDEAGNATSTQTFDVFGRDSGTTQPGVATPFTQTFSLANRTTQMTGPNGASGTTEFNEKHDPIRVTDARGNASTMTYNNYRDVTSMKGADNQTRQFYLDAKGHRIATVTPSGRADRAFFNSFGNPTVTFHSPVDADFNNAFDADHFFTASTYTNYTTDYTQYAYSTTGNLIGVTDANLQTKTFGYSTKGDMTLSKDARGKQTDYTYDISSKLTRVRNALGHQVDLTYDTRDNVTQIATAAGTVNYGYNTKNQVTSVTTGNVGARRSTNYTYNAKGQIGTVTDPNGVLTQYTYDARGNLTEIRHDGISRFTYTYDGLNRLTSTNYSGTSGGTRPSVIPTSPAGGEVLRGGGPITVKWLTQGDWTGSTNVTLQYSTDGINWINIATVGAAGGSYVWATPVNSDTLRIRFLRSGDSTFRTSSTPVFSQSTSAKYYVNDGSTVGDQYCTVAGQTYNGTTVTGRTPSNPVNNPQAIIDNNVLLPGDIIYIDTGAYSMTQDIVLTQADTGSAAKPITIQGPTSGSGAVITRVPSANSYNATLLIYDTNPADTTTLQGIVVQNIKTVGGRNGIWIKDAQYCAVRDSECSLATLPGAAGAQGFGNGIFLDGGGNHVVERNSLHHNGSNGGAGGTGAAGGNGSGVGLNLLSSNSNTIRFNECYANQGTGGVGGSTTAAAGISLGYGILIDGCASTVLTDNVSHDNDATGVPSTTGIPGNAQVFGIYADTNTNSTIERNRCYGNDAVGGSSTAKNGGQGWGNGLIVVGEANARIANNAAYSNSGIGGLSSTAATFTNGLGEGDGIYISSCANAVLINNLSYGNFGSTAQRRVSENGGSAFGHGLKIEACSGATVLHNTIERNRGLYGNSQGTSSTSIPGAQILFTSSSTGGTVKNNACGSYNLFAPCISVTSNSQTGFVADYNDWYVISQSGSVGRWGNTFISSISGWRSSSSQDSNSISLDPQFYNQPGETYHLKSTSPLIDKGVAVSQSGADVDGENRPQQGPNPAIPAASDIGFDEFLDTDGDLLADYIENQVTLTNPNLGDSDNDGMPDEWEVSNGLNPNSGLLANGALGDPDTDGYSNLQEYLGRSDPNLASSIPGQPPVITAATPSVTNPLIFEEESISFAATALDANSDPISYSWRLDGIVKSMSGSYLFETDSDSSGATALSRSYTIELRVIAGGDEVSRSWVVTVNNRNHTPVLAAMSNLNVRPGNTIQLNPVYFDPDNQNFSTADDNSLSVSFTGFMSQASRLITPEDIGAHSVTVTVTDDGIPALYAQRTFQINVINAGIQVESESGSFSVTEGAGQTFYSIVLTSEPSATVTVYAGVFVPLEVDHASLVFTADNWDIPQVIGVSAPDSFIAEGVRVFAIGHTAVSSDPLYSNIPVSDLVVTIKDPAFDEWRVSHFSAAELSDATISGDLADPNHNGISNLVEYGLVGDPRADGSSLDFLPQVSMTGSGKRQLVFNRYVSRNDVSISVEAAASLEGPWQGVARSSFGSEFDVLVPGAVVSETGAGSLKRVSIVDSYSINDPDQPRRFLRVTVRRP